MEEKTVDQQAKIDAAKAAKEKQDNGTTGKSGPGKELKPGEGQISEKVVIDLTGYNKMVILAMTEDGLIDIIMPDKYKDTKKYEIMGILKQAMDDHLEMRIIKNILFNVDEMINVKILGKQPQGPSGSRIIVPGGGIKNPLKS